MKTASTTDLAGPVPVPLAGLLVVDDEDQVRSLLAHFLTREGFSVWIAANGDEALDVYRNNHQDIHLVLLDVRMPRRDGPATLAALQQINPVVRCCFISGEIAPYTREELLRCGGLAVLMKPFVLAELVVQLRQLLAPAP